MADLYFEVEADYTNVVRMREEIDMLERQLANMDRNAEGFASMNDMLVSMKTEFDGLIAKAAEAASIKFDGFNKELEDTNAKLQGLVEVESRLNKEIEETQTKINEASVARQNAISNNDISSVDEQNRIIGDLNDNLTTLKSELNDVEDSKLKVSIDLDVKTKEYEDFVGGIRNGEVLVPTRFNIEQTALIDKAQTANTKMSMAKATMDNSEVGSSEWANALSDLEKYRVEQNDASREFLENIEKRKAQIKEEEVEEINKLSILIKSREEKEKEINLHESNIAKKKEEIEAERASHDENTAKVERLKEEIELARQLREEKKKAFLEAEGKNNEYVLNRAVYEDKFQNLQSQEQTAKDDKGKLQKDAQDLKGRYERAMTKGEDQSVIDELYDKWQNKLEKIEEVEKKIEDLTKLRKEAENELNKFIKDNSGERGEYRIARDEFEKSHKLVNDKTKELETAKKEANIATSLVDIKTQNINNETDASLRAADELKDIDKQIEEQKKKIDESKAERDKFYAESKAQTKELSKVSSVVVEPEKIEAATREYQRYLALQEEIAYKTNVLNNTDSSDESYARLKNDIDELKKASDEAANDFVRASDRKIFAVESEIQKTKESTQALIEKRNAYLDEINTAIKNRNEIQKNIEDARNLGKDTSDMERMLAEQQKALTDAQHAVIQLNDQITKNQTLVESKTTALGNFKSNFADKSASMGVSTNVTASMIGNTRSASNGIGEVAKQADVLDEAFNKVANSGNTFKSVLDKVASTAAGFTVGSLATGGIVAGLNKVMEIRNEALKVHGEMVSIERTMKVFLKDEDKAKEFLSKVEDAAINNMFSFHDIAAASKQMLAFGISVEKIIPTINQLSDIAVGTGNSLNQLVSMYTRAKSIGFVDSRSQRVWAANGIVLKDVLKEMGVQANGTKITFDQLSAAIEHMTSQGGLFNGVMESNMQGVQALKVRLGDTMHKMYDEIGASMSSSFATTLEWQIKMTENWKTIARVLGGVVTAVGSYRAALILLKVVKEALNGGELTKKLLKRANELQTKQNTKADLELAAAKQTEATATARNAAATGADSTSKAVNTAATQTNTAATTANAASKKGLIGALVSYTKAQWAANAAALANPYVLLAAVVALLCVRIYQLCTAESEEEKGHRRATDAIKAYNDAMQETINKEDELLGRITDENALMSEKIRSYKELVKMMPELGRLKTQEEFLAMTPEQQREYIKRMQEARKNDKDITIYETARQVTGRYNGESGVDVNDDRSFYGTMNSWAHTLNRYADPIRWALSAWDEQWTNKLEDWSTEKVNSVFGTNIEGRFKLNDKGNKLFDIYEKIAQKNGETDLLSRSADNLEQALAYVQKMQDISETGAMAVVENNEMMEMQSKTIAEQNDIHTKRADILENEAELIKRVSNEEATEIEVTNNLSASQVDYDEAKKACDEAEKAFKESLEDETISVEKRGELYVDWQIKAKKSDALKKVYDRASLLSDIFFRALNATNDNFFSEEYGDTIQGEVPMTEEQKMQLEGAYGEVNSEKEYEKSKLIQTTNYKKVLSEQKRQWKQLNDYSYNFKKGNFKVTSKEVRDIFEEEKLDGKNLNQWISDAEKGLLSVADKKKLQEQIDEVVKGKKTAYTGNGGDDIDDQKALQKKNALIAQNEDYLKAQQDLDRKRIDNIYASTQAEINAMSEGEEKKRRQRELDHKKNMEKIKRSYEDELKTARDAAKKRWETDKKNKDREGKLRREFRDSDLKEDVIYNETLVELARKRRTEMAEEYTRYKNTDSEKRNEEEEALKLFEKYRSYEDKRADIERKYDDERRIMIENRQKFITSEIEKEIKASQLSLEAARAVRDEFGSGNDLVNSPIVTASQLAKAGWEGVAQSVKDTEIALFNLGTDENPIMKIAVRPTLDNGELMDKDSFEQYVSSVINGQEDNLHVFINLDVNKNTEEVNSVRKDIEEFNNVLKTTNATFNVEGFTEEQKAKVDTLSTAIQAFKEQGGLFEVGMNTEEDYARINALSDAIDGVVSMDVSKKVKSQLDAIVSEISTLGKSVENFRNENGTIILNAETNGIDQIKELEDVLNGMKKVASNGEFTESFSSMRNSVKEVASKTKDYLEEVKRVYSEVLNGGDFSKEAVESAFGKSNLTEIAKIHFTDIYNEAANASEEVISKNRFTTIFDTIIGEESERRAEIRIANIKNIADKTANGINDVMSALKVDTSGVNTIFGMFDDMSKMESMIADVNKFYENGIMRLNTDENKKSADEILSMIENGSIDTFEKASKIIKETFREEDFNIFTSGGTIESVKKELSSVVTKERGNEIFGFIDGLKKSGMTDDLFRSSIEKLNGIKDLGIFDYFRSQGISSVEAIQDALNGLYIPSDVTETIAYNTKNIILDDKKELDDVQRESVDRFNTIISSMLNGNGNIDLGDTEEEQIKRVTRLSNAISNLKEDVDISIFGEDLEKQINSLEKYAMSFKSVTTTTGVSVSKEQIVGINEAISAIGRNKEAVGVMAKAIDGEFTNRVKVVGDSVKGMGEDVQAAYKNVIDSVGGDNKTFIEMMEKVSERAMTMRSDITSLEAVEFNIDDKLGIGHKVLISPVLPNGDVMNKEEFTKYVEENFKTFEDVAKNESLHMVVAVDYDIRKKDTINDALMTMQNPKVSAEIDLVLNDDTLDTADKKISALKERLSTIGSGSLIDSLNAAMPTLEGNNTSLINVLTSVSNSSRIAKEGIDSLMLFEKNIKEGEVKKTITINPVLPNGHIMSEQEINDYVDNVVKASNVEETDVKKIVVDIDKETFNKSVSELATKATTIREALGKTENLTTEDRIASVRKSMEEVGMNEQFNTLSMSLGNSDALLRQLEAISDAANVTKNDIQSVYKFDVTDNSGLQHQIVVSAVDKDGNPLTENYLSDYINTMVESAKDFDLADTQNLIIGVDTKIDNVEEFQKSLSLLSKSLSTIGNDTMASATLDDIRIKLKEIGEENLIDELIAKMPQLENDSQAVLNIIRNYTDTYTKNEEDRKSVMTKMFSFTDDEGKERKVLINPVLPNGDILSPDAVNEYIKSTFEGKSYTTESDWQHIVVKIDAEEKDRERLEMLMDELKGKGAQLAAQMLAIYESADAKMKEMLDKQIEAKTKELIALDKEQMELQMENLSKDPTYFLAMRNVDRVSTNALANLNEQLEKMRDTLTDLSPEDLRTITDLMEKISDAVIKRDPFKALKDSTDALADAQKRLKKALIEVQKAREAFHATDKEYDAANAKYNNSVAEIEKNYNKQIGDKTSERDALQNSGLSDEQRIAEEERLNKEIENLKTAAKNEKDKQYDVILKPIVERRSILSANLTTAENAVKNETVNVATQNSNMNQSMKGIIAEAKELSSNLKSLGSTIGDAIGGKAGEWIKDIIDLTTEIFDDFMSGLDKQIDQNIQEQNTMALSENSDEIARNTEQLRALNAKNSNVADGANKLGKKTNEVSDAIEKSVEQTTINQENVNESITETNNTTKEVADASKDMAEASANAPTEKTTETEVGKTIGYGEGDTELKGETQLSQSQKAMQGASAIMQGMQMGISVGSKVVSMFQKTGVGGDQKYAKYAEKLAEINKLKNSVLSYQKAALAAKQAEDHWFGKTALQGLIDSWGTAQKTMEQYYSVLNEQQAAYRDQTKHDGDWMGNVIMGALAGATTGFLTSGMNPYMAIVGGIVGGVAGATTSYAEQALGNNNYQKDSVRAQDNLRIETREKKKSFMWIGGHDQETADLRTWAKEKYGADLFDSNGMINTELGEEILENYSDKLQGQTEATIRQLMEISEQYKEYEESLKEYVNSLYSPIADSMTDAIWTWLESGKDALAEFRDAASQTFKAIASDMLKQLVMENVFGSYEDDIKDLYKQYSAKQIDEETLMSKVSSATQEVMLNYETQLPILTEMAQQLSGIIEDSTGVDIINETAGSGTGNVTSNVTQDSIDETNGRMSAIQMICQMQLTTITELKGDVSLLIASATERNYNIIGIREQMSQAYLEMQGIHDDTTAIKKDVRTMINTYFSKWDESIKTQ